MSPAPQKRKTVVFLHPDLGIGGAERLVVDAAVGLQKRGHKVVIFTSHCDPAHCFDEARDGTLDVRVRGHTLVPPSVLSRFSILCAILRQLHLILHCVLVSGELAAADAFFVDQLSAGLPLLRWLLPRAPIFFYCHFPDLLLAQGRARWWKRAYRVPFDTLEQWSMGFADAIAVNSGFTRGVVGRTWPALAQTRDLKVVYPCIDVRAAEADEDVDKGGVAAWKKMGVVLSINRFEKKKDVALAIRAFAGLSQEKRRGAKLVVAGGYDPRVPENVSYHSELVALADSLGLTNATAKDAAAALAAAPSADVLFLLSVPNALKDTLLRAARLLVYTPANEHFGIVPLEAMLRGVPVLAANTGGPTETVIEGKTGWLRDPAQVESWTVVMDDVLNRLGPAELERMGREGREWTKKKFSDTQMAETLDDILDSMEGIPRKGPGLALVLIVFAALVSVLSAMGTSVLLAKR